jgi:transposase
MEKFLTEKQVSEFKKIHKQTKIVRNADRIKAILMLNNEYSYEQIAEILMLDGETVRKWHKIFETYGLTELLADHYLGSQPKLCIKVQNELSKHLENNIYLSAKAVKQHVEKKYSVMYTSKGITDLLHRMGFTYKKPKHLPGKLNRDAQEKFVIEYKKLKRDKSAEDHIYFMDGTHPMHNSQLAYGWIRKGKDKFVKANTGRERLNLNGAYDIENHKVLVREDKSINAQSTIALLKQLTLKQRKGILYIFLDNARYYRSKMVQKFLQKNNRIQFKFLPSYSPNLNLIERLWKWIKKKVSYNDYFEKFSKFREKIFGYFENIKLYNDELKPLMSEKFQLFPV